MCVCGRACVRACQSCPWIGLTHGLGWVEIFQFLVGWVGSTTAKVLKISKDYVNVFKARLDKIWLHQAVKFVSCIGLGQSDDGLGWIGTQRVDPGTTLMCVYASNMCCGDVAEGGGVSRQSLYRRVSSAARSPDHRPDLHGRVPRGRDPGQCPLQRSALPARRAAQRRRADDRRPSHVLRLPGAAAPPPGRRACLHLVLLHTRHRRAALGSRLLQRQAGPGAAQLEGVAPRPKRMLAASARINARTSYR